MTEYRRDGKKRKSKQITFRIDMDVLGEIEARAILAGKDINGWCRDEIIARIRGGITFTANEELIHAEIVSYGQVLATFLHHIAVNRTLTPEVSQQLLDALNKGRKEIAKEYADMLIKLARGEDK